MLVILFKDQNDSILKLLDNRDSYKFVVDPININKLTIPDFVNAPTKPKLPKYTVDRFTHAFLSQEPEITSYGEKVQGRND
jgi:hypothetical protein